MKHLKKILAATMALFVAFAMVGTALAQTVDSEDGGNATITIANASKGETYSVAKLFDASVTGNTGGSVRYEGTIPEALSAYFTKDSNGVISATSALDFSQAAVQTAFKNWAASNSTASAVSDGSVLTFTNLQYGYYIVTTTQGETSVTVNTTNPNASLVDKNSSSPLITDETGKLVNDEIVSIGQEVSYTVTFRAVNFDGAGENAKRIASYTIHDSLPNFLSDVTVSSIVVNDGTAHNLTVTQFDENGNITIPWTNEAKTQSLYNNNATVAITYTATVNNNIAAGNVVTNANAVTLTWTDVDGTNHGGGDDYTVTETILTAAAAIQKVDENGANLAGATFSIKGLTVTGDNGNYTVTSYDASDNAAAGTTMVADSNGLIVIRGIAADATLVATEVDAPDGYNKLAGTTNVTPVLTETTTTVTTVYLDEDGNVTNTETNKTQVNTNSDLVTGAVKIQNLKGSTLPSTGGIGTTLFYVIGGILVAGAAIALVVKNRVAKEEK